MIGSGNNTPEEGTVAETKRQRPPIQGSMREEEIVPEMKGQRLHI